MNFKKVILNIVRAIILMTIKIEDFEFDEILLDEKPLENNLIYDISYKLQWVQNHCVLGSNK